MGCNVLLVFHQMVFVPLIIHAASTIFTGPQDTDAIIGGNVTLYCTVGNLGSNTVVWRRHDSPTEYSKNRTIQSELPSYYSERYRVIGSDSEGTFNLYITNVDEFLENNQVYQCIIEDNMGNLLDFSEGAQLLVHDEPMQPECNLDSNMDLKDGEQITFGCVFESSISKVNMNLAINSNTLLNEIVDPDSYFTSESSVNFTVTANHDGAELRCMVDHQIFQVPYECSLVLHVKNKPVVEISQAGTLYDGNASFACENVATTDALQTTVSLCVINSDIVCFDLGDDIITIENCNSEHIGRANYMLYLGDMCYVFKVREAKLPVYVLLKHGLVIPDYFTVGQCVLRCLATNAVGVGSDAYIIKNATCLFLSTASTPATVPTVATTAQNATITTDGIMTKNTILTDNVSENDIPIWSVFVLGFVACGLLCFIIFLIICRRFVFCYKEKLNSGKEITQATQENQLSDYETHLPKSSSDNYMPYIIDDTTKEITDNDDYMELNI